MFVSVSSVLRSDLPGPGAVAATVLSPSGSPVTTPSSWWFPSGSGPKEEVTSAPFSVTSTAERAVPAGTATSIRASPPETYCGRARDDAELQLVVPGDCCGHDGERCARGGNRAPDAW